MRANSCQLYSARGFRSFQLLWKVTNKRLLATTPPLFLWSETLVPLQGFVKTIFDSVKPVSKLREANAFSVVTVRRAEPTDRHVTLHRSKLVERPRVGIRFQFRLHRITR